MIRNPEGGLQNIRMHASLNEDRFDFHRDLAMQLDAPFVELSLIHI